MRRTSACCPATRRFRSSGACPAWSSRKEKSASWAKRSSRTYVDGRPLFGENARSALDFLAANDVVDIQVYDELPEEERLKGNKNGKKRTVMNLVTRSKPEKSVNVEALAGYGADIDRGPDGHRKGRYGAGASYNYFSERRIYSVEANSNNNNQSSNRIRDRFASYAGRRRRRPPQHDARRQPDAPLRQASDPVGKLPLRQRAVGNAADHATDLFPVGSLPVAQLHRHDPSLAPRQATLGQSRSAL